MLTVEPLKDFIGVKKDVKEITLGVKDKSIIQKLLKVAPKNYYIVYFESMPVEDIYDGYEFVSEEEEFYYYNSDSFLVFRDITDFKVKIQYSTLKKVKKITTFEEVCNVTRQAVKYTKAHPEVSKYKVY